MLSLTAACGRNTEPPGSIAVLVVDDQRTPLSGVTVTLKSPHISPGIKNITSGSGQCNFSSLKPGNRYVLECQKKGFISQVLQSVPVNPGQITFIQASLKVDNQILPGRWRILREGTNTSLNSRQKETIRKLETLSYLSGYKTAPKKQGVTIYDKQKAFNGFNLYCSGHAPEAILMDMTGNTLHRWHYDIQDLWKQDYDPRSSGYMYWRRVHLLGNGDLLAIFDGYGLIKIDKDSNLIWGYNGKAHHDLTVMPDGKIYVLTREAFVEPKYNKTEPIVDDFIVILTPSGKEIRRISILKSLENSKYNYVLAKMARKGDILHTNTIEVLNGELENKSPAFKAGNVLISILYLDLIAIVDIDKETVVWAMSGLWKRQHQPTIMANGHMLIFDNLYGEEPVSRVLEFDPFTRQIYWEYRGTPETPFYTGDCGSCQHLPNGNTLISESNSGRAFEVTQDKTMVWEFYNPHRAGENNELIATLFELIRLAPDSRMDWLKKR